MILIKKKEGWFLFLISDRLNLINKRFYKKSKEDFGFWGDEKGLGKSFWVLGGVLESKKDKVFIIGY